MPYKDKTKQKLFQKYWDAAKRIRARKIKNALRKKGCLLCLERTMCCLTFHHLNPKDKLLNIGSGMHKGIPTASRNPVIEQIITEAKKCVVLCRNCHAKTEAGKLSKTAAARIELARKDLESIRSP